MSTKSPVQLNMAVIKPDPDSDGESHPISFCNENELLGLKEDEDRPFIKCPVMKFERELQLNDDTVEHETCVLPHSLAELNEGDVSHIKHDDLSVSPAFPMIKCETEVNVDFINSVPNSNSKNKEVDIKGEEDPLLITFQDMQEKNEATTIAEALEGTLSVPIGVASEQRQSHVGERPFPCDICKKSFNKRCYLNNHIRVHTGERPFSCDVCKKSFSNRCGLTRHIRVHTGELPYSCHICKKYFSESGHVKVHMREHTGERPFSCDVCKKSFSVRCSLTRHMRVHTGERPYSCHICKRCFSESGHLKVHFREHTGERPFLCGICQKSFSQRCNLKRHMRLHTGERPFQCDMCKKCFVESSHLKVHMREHTGERPFSCRVCKKAFITRGALNRHYRVHTGDYSQPV